jgi:DNA repair protein RadA/Sms
MARKQAQFVCTDCGADYPKWTGQCLQCGAWNSVTEFREARMTGAALASSRSGFTGQKAVLQRLDSIVIESESRLSTGSPEFDRVLGGGLVVGSVVLLGGSPGAGKSTLLLQTACRLARNLKVLYVTGEESIQQVALRAHRLQLETHQLDVMSETDVDVIIATAEVEKPALLVIDSIQVMVRPDVQSVPGSVSQVRECAALLTRLAKQSGTILLLVGHVTKDGSLAGPKVLEHMIDASIMLEGAEDNRFRTLRANKNRFGAVNELGVFAMLEQGMKDVKNPSALFLTREDDDASGSVATVVWEGTRPLLVEIQALLDTSYGGQPRRLAVGYDQQRLALLLAVLSRHGGLQLGDQDVFLNVVGGVRITETSADLAIVMALISSLKNRPVSKRTAAFGEVGLSGEIRPVVSGQERAIEAHKHGFEKVFLPKANLPRKLVEGLECVAVSRVSELLDYL